MKKIIITLAAFAALSTVAFANDGGNDNATFGDGVINGAPAPQDVNSTLISKRGHRLTSQQNISTANNGYQNYIDLADQRNLDESNRGTL